MTNFYTFSGLVQAGRGTARRGKAWLGLAGQGNNEAPGGQQVQNFMARRGLAWPGGAGQGWARLGAAWLGLAWLGMARQQRDTRAVTV